MDRKEAHGAARDPGSRGFSHDTFRHAMQALDDAGVPVLVGGAYAFERYTGHRR